MEYITLNDGNKIPIIGYGVFELEPGEATRSAVSAALAAGYRHIDTAAAYFNEADVGAAVRESGIPRDEIWITSKLWIQDYGYEAAKQGIDTSLKKLGTDYIDLYLLHHPYGDVCGAWQALEEAKRAGKLRSIGVSNMTVKFWRELTPQFDTTPAINQMECNPLCQQRALRDEMSGAGTAIEAWYPLGHGDKKLLTNPLIEELAAKYGRDTGQIILRFETQEGIIVLPKSVNPAHIAGNIDIFDFTLSDGEMESLRALDTGRGGHDPEKPGVEKFLRTFFDVHKG